MIPRPLEIFEWSRLPEAERRRLLTRPVEQAAVAVRAQASDIIG